MRLFPVLFICFFLAQACYPVSTAGRRSLGGKAETGTIWLGDIKMMLADLRDTANEYGVPTPGDKLGYKIEHTPEYRMSVRLIPCVIVAGPRKGQTGYAVDAYFTHGTYKRADKIDALYRQIEQFFSVKYTRVTLSAGMIRERK